MTEKRYGKKVDDVDDTIINITEDGNDFAWFLSDDYTDEQVDKIVQRLNKLTVENEQLKKQIERIDFILDDLNGAEYISRDDGIKALNKIDKVIGKR